MLGHLGLGLVQIGAKAFIHSALTKHDRDLAGTLSINPQTQHGENPTFTPGEKVTGRPMAQDGEDTRSMNPFPCQGEIGWTHKETQSNHHVSPSLVSLHNHGRQG